MSLDEIKAALNEHARALPDPTSTPRVCMTLADLIRLDPTTRMRRRRGRVERRARLATSNGAAAASTRRWTRWRMTRSSREQATGRWARRCRTTRIGNEFKAGVPKDAEIERFARRVRERSRRPPLPRRDRRRPRQGTCSSPTRGDRDALRLRIDGIVKRTQSEKADSTLEAVVRMRFVPKEAPRVAIVTVKEGCRRVIATANGKIYRRLSGSVQELSLQAADQLRRQRRGQRRQDHIRRQIAAGASLSSPSESYSSSLSPSPARSSASKRSVDDSDASTQGSEDGGARQRTGGADSSSESDTDDDGAGQMRQMRPLPGAGPGGGGRGGER